jgi:hypothetical protein
MGRQQHESQGRGGSGSPSTLEWTDEEEDYCKTVMKTSMEEYAYLQGLAYYDVL